ncbi:SDR family oxidoreductase [Paenibacillus dendritiformis]|uniref:SDR family oxidoreductase n=1 Tax=Paenibacillus dendritiformis TaxID=130049 RepID=UPI0020C3F6F1|nr:SDR family oxidoreductase [Paenibacillus dendritiformis]CAH8770733.1 SDR family oxidoreductase [Paenibacillus dendritiformis]
MEMTKRDAGKAADHPVAFVTGASSGFGMLASVKLAEQGYRVIATMRGTSRPEALAALAAAHGVESRLEVRRVDVTDAASIEAAVAHALGAYGRIDLLVNNAGYAQGGYVEDVTMEQWRAQFETNVFGAIAAAKAVLPHMREQGRGTIINIGSISGRIAFPGYAPYAAAKFAIEGFSESLRLEMKPYGVDVVLIEPGAYPTNIWEKGFSSMAVDDASPYRNRLENILRFSRQSASSKADPWEVAHLIARIAADKRPRFRYPIGSGARLLLAAKALLPWALIEKAVMRILR